MPKYRPLEVFTESESDDEDDWDDDDLIMSFPRRKRRRMFPCWRTKRRRLICVVLTALALILVLVGVGVGVGVYLHNKMGTIVDTQKEGDNETTLLFTSTMSITTTVNSTTKSIEPSSPGFEPTSSMLTSSPGFKPTSSMLTSSPGFGPKSSMLTSSPGFGPTYSMLTSSPGFGPKSSMLTSSPGFGPTSSMLTSSPGFGPTSTMLTSSPGFGPASSMLTSSPGFGPASSMLTLSPGFEPTSTMLTSSPGFGPTSSMLTSSPGFEPTFSMTTSSPGFEQTSMLISSQEIEPTVSMATSTMSNMSPEFEPTVSVLISSHEVEPTLSVATSSHEFQSTMSMLISSHEVEPTVSMTPSSSRLKPTVSMTTLSPGFEPTVSMTTSSILPTSAMWTSAAVTSVGPTPSPSPSPGGLCTRTDEVCKPLTDQSEYRVLTLNNSLRVLLVSNNETSTSAAAVDVYSGSMNEGDIQGLAHFCEHMLFLGTEKYPNEEDYSKYLSTNGGYDNAYTSSENTNYYLSVNSDKLEGALDRLAQFFVSPLFNASGVDREKNAVNSEYEKDKGIPGWVDYLMMKTVSTPLSPFSRFTIGNLKTFNVSDLVEQLKHYYNRRYSANLMQVAIFGKEDLDTLQKWAVRYFEEIPNKRLQPPEKPYPPYPDGYSPRIIVYKPLGSTPYVNIVWQTPNLQDHYRSRVSQLLKTLFTFQGNGSLDDLLREKNKWSTSVSFEVDSYSNFALAILEIQLTALGEKSLDDVMSTVFAYIKHLKNSSSSKLEGVWESARSLEQLNFKFSDPPSNIPRYASDLAGKMRTTVDPIDFLSPPERFVWDPELVNTVLDQLSPHRCNIFYAKPSVVLNATAAAGSNHGDCSSSSTARHDFNVSSVDLVEPYFGTAYGVYCIPLDLVETWEHVPALEGVGLPRLDMFVPQELSLLPVPTNFTGTPEKILDNKHGYTVWWMQDSQFRNPVQIFRCEANTSVPGESPYSRAMSNLYKKYISNVLSGVAYYGGLANYEVTFDLSYRGVYLEFSGYSDSNVMMTFMRQVLEAIVDHSPTVLSANEGRLHLGLLQAVDELRNYNTSNLPYQYVRDFIMTLLEDPNYYYKNVLDELVKFNSSSEDFVFEVSAFMSNVLGSISSLTCYSTGNVDKKQSLACADLVHDMLVKTSSSDASVHRGRLLKVSKGVTAFTIPTLNPTKDPNSAIYVVDQVGPVCEVLSDPGDGSPVTCTDQSLSNTVYSHLLNLMIKDACFDQLRTKEQLGYAVSCGTVTLEHSLNLVYFLVQSAVQPPSYLLNRTWEFVHAFKNVVLNDIGTFSSTVDVYKTLLRAKEKTLEDQVERIWGQLSTQKFRFNYTDKLMEVANHVTHGDFEHFFNKFVYDHYFTDTEVDSKQSVRELVVGAFQDVTSLQFDQIPQDRQYRLEDIVTFKNTTKSWDI